MLHVILSFYLRYMDPGIADPGSRYKGFSPVPFLRMFFLAAHEQGPVLVVSLYFDVPQKPEVPKTQVSKTLVHESPELFFTKSSDIVWLQLQRLRSAGCMEDAPLVRATETTFWQKPCWQMYAHGLHGYLGASARVAPLRDYH